MVIGWHRRPQWLLAAGAAWVCATAGVSAAQTDPIRQGEYVLRAAGCVACHTDTENDGPFLAGGRRLETPFGVFHSPNITPDPEHGIGRWTETDFIAALSEGLAPDGSHFYPVFPYTSYTRMGAGDMRALWAYLGTVKAEARPDRPHDLPWYLRWRGLVRGWKWWGFEPGPLPDRADRSASWNRGAYLAEALGHCGECHTPRDWLGAPVAAMHLAGTRDGPEGEAVPNITPDRRTGIGRWSRDDLLYFLETGGTSDGDYTGGLMAEVVDESTRHLTAADREALATYLLSLPPIDNAVSKPEKKTKQPRGEFD
jgi:mono/diheme cytochrome c family protein